MSDKFEISSDAFEDAVVDAVMSPVRLLMAQGHEPVAIVVVVAGRDSANLCSTALSLHSRYPDDHVDEFILRKAKETIEMELASRCTDDGGKDGKEVSTAISCSLLVRCESYSRLEDRRRGGGVV